MSSIALSENDWNTLIGRIEDKKCTPFLGAGANYGILPTGTDVASAWANEYHYPFEDKFDLARIAQFVAIDRDDQVWPKEEILRIFRKRVGQIDIKAILREAVNPLTALAELPIAVYMTTNYDDFMYKALQLEGKQPCIDLCRWNEFLQRRPSVLEGRSRVEPTAEKPVIFHLHGHQDLAESVVLTEDDYLDFLISMSREEEIMPKRIREALAYSSLLFIGYRLADLNFRVLFRGLFRGMEDSLRRTSIAVQLPPTHGPSAQAYLDRYFGKLRIKVYWGDAAEFAAELQKRWRERQR